MRKAGRGRGAFDRKGSKGARAEAAMGGRGNDAMEVDNGCPRTWTLALAFRMPGKRTLPRGRRTPSLHPQRLSSGRRRATKKLLTTGLSSMASYSTTTASTKNKGRARLTRVLRVIQLSCRARAGSAMLLRRLYSFVATLNPSIIRAHPTHRVRRTRALLDGFTGSRFTLLETRGILVALPHWHHGSLHFFCVCMIDGKNKREEIKEDRIVDTPPRRPGVAR